jgi:hypothetical protein
VQRFLGAQQVNVKLENDESWNLLLSFADKTGAFQRVGALVGRVSVLQPIIHHGVVGIP